MNRAIVISRYATTLVKYVRETGQGDRVCQEADKLLQALQGVPELSRMMDAAADVVSFADKLSLLQSALGQEMSPELTRFLTLLCRNGRMEMVTEILRDFTDRYRRGKGVRKAHLVTVSEPSASLLERLAALVKEKTGDDVQIECSTDPQLIGGFVFDIDDLLLDASVKRQLDLIREQFIESNRRII